MFYFTTSISQCPVCKTPNTFRSRDANMKICPVCNTAMERLEGQGITKTLALIVAKKDERNIIQTGTKGKYNNKKFEVIGCLHCEFTRYNSKRWTIIYEDGSSGLLTESYGFFAILEKITPENPGKLSTIKNRQVATESIDLMNNEKAYIFDKDNCERSFLEGEVLLPDTDGVFSAIELGDENSNRYELIEWQKERYELFTVKYVSFETLALSNTQEPSRQPLVLSCCHCKKGIPIKLPQYSQHCICPHCQAWNEIKPGSQLQLRSKHLSSFKPAIPVGSKGTINGIEYEVTGAANKNEAGSIETFWREYILYSPQHGFAYLAEYNGHWTFLKEVKLGSPWPEFKDELAVDGKVFDLFNKYSFKVVDAVGEFNSSISGSSIQVREYIAPPIMYSAEYEAGKEIAWFKGELISATEVFEGFSLSVQSAPLITGIGPLQLQKFHINHRLLSRMAVIAVLVFFAVQLFFSFNAKQQLVYENNFLAPDSMLSKGINSSSFELKASSSNLVFEISSPVSNSWFEAAITLVNDKTGKEYSFEKGVEYYSGLSDGEFWTEGKKSDDVTLSSIPAGNYHLNIFPSFGTAAPTQEFSISITNDVPIWSNFIIVILMLSLYPAIMWWRNRVFEDKRWNNASNNTPQTDNDE